MMTRIMTNGLLNCVSLSSERPLERQIGRLGKSRPPVATQMSVAASAVPSHFDSRLVPYSSMLVLILPEPRRPI